MAGISSTPSRRRTGRTSRLAAVERAPVMLELHCHSVLYVGYVGQPRAKHILKIPPVLERNAPEYYRIYAPTIEKAYHRLAQDPKERKVIVLYDGGIFLHHALQEALERILLEDMRSPACCFHPSLRMVPTAFPPTQDGMLIVQFSVTEAHCVAHAAGHSLDFTYQIASVGGKREMFSNPSLSEVAALQSRLTTPSPDAYPSLLTQAILLCIDACPRELRRRVVENICFVGIMAEKDMGVKVAREVRNVLRSSSVEDSSVIQVEQSPEDSNVVEWVRLPVNLKIMKPLADAVSVIRLGSLRSELVPWVGASVWASHWHGIQPSSERFEWISKST